MSIAQPWPVLRGEAPLCWVAPDEGAAEAEVACEVPAAVETCVVDAGLAELAEERALVETAADDATAVTAEAPIPSATTTPASGC